MKIEIGDTVFFHLTMDGDWGRSEIVQGVVDNIIPDKAWGLCYYVSWTNKNGYGAMAIRPANKLRKQMTSFDLDELVEL